MNMKSHSEAEFLLLKILAQEGDDLLLEHQWAWEGDRWKELVFAMISRIANVPDDRMRNMIDLMSELNLLDIPTLADAAQGNGTINVESPNSKHILNLLEEGGFCQVDAQRSLTIICEAAEGFQKHFKGKIQLFLRKYGEMMLADFSQYFTFSFLDKADLRFAVTYWLQNTLNMPLSLIDENVQTFCSRYKLEPTQLIELADEIDLNLALMDDLVQLHLLQQEADKEDPHKEKIRKVG